MSGRPQKDKKEDNDLFGAIAGGLLLAGAAAAAGYVAYKKFRNEKPEESKTKESAKGHTYWGSDSSSHSNYTSNMYNHSSPHPRQPSPPATGSKMGAHSSSKGEDPKLLRCIICQENEREVLFEPCKHIGLCEDCADTTTECPQCYMGIVAKKPVYL